MGVFWFRNFVGLQNAKCRFKVFFQNKEVSVPSKVYKLVVKDYLHKVFRWVVELARVGGIGEIVVGSMHKNIEQMDLGHQKNEKLHRILFGKMVTSQICSVCGFKDKSSRKHRGLYVCKHCGVVLNADVNGARNIFFRVVPNPVMDRDSGFGHPRRIRVLQAPDFA